MKSKIKSELTKHEERITSDIKADKNNQKIWQHINKLSGKSNNKKKEIIIYDEKGVQEKIYVYPMEIKEFGRKFITKK